MLLFGVLLKDRRCNQLVKMYRTAYDCRYKLWLLTKWAIHTCLPVFTLSWLPKVKIGVYLSFRHVSVALYCCLTKFSSLIEIHKDFSLHTVYTCVALCVIERMDMSIYLSMSLCVWMYICVFYVGDYNTFYQLNY